LLQNNAVGLDASRIGNDSVWIRCRLFDNCVLRASRTEILWFDSNEAIEDRLWIRGLDAGGLIRTARDRFWLCGYADWNGERHERDENIEERSTFHGISLYKKGRKRTSWVNPPP
jgi:hypothetical protein